MQIVQGAMMILITSLFTGIFAAMLRSLFAVISVAFMISVAFAAAAVLGGTSVVLLLLSMAGFNAGLILFAAAHVYRSGARSA